MRLFISYAREDIQQAAHISAILRSGGHITWYDEELLPGQNWEAQLQKEIEACEAFVVAMTKVSLKSEWCIWELATAIRSHKAIIPVLLEPDLDIPPSIEKLQFCDYSRGASAEQTARLMYALTSMQKVAISLAPTLPANPQGAPSRAAADFLEIVKDKYINLDLKISIELKKNEVVVDKFVVTYMKSATKYSKGVLMVTNERLIFEVYKLQLMKMDPFSISLRTISDMTSVKVWIVMGGVTVHCRSGEKYTFATYSAGKMMQVVREQMKNLS